tara:strand:- start:458 stop:673 length:216 start_codon:yes stop_codon:yes gene_type:complete
MDGTPVISEKLAVTTQGLMRGLLLVCDPRIDCVHTAIVAGRIVHIYDDPRFPQSIEKNIPEHIGNNINTII